MLADVPWGKRWSCSLAKERERATGKRGVKGKEKPGRQATRQKEAAKTLRPSVSYALCLLAGTVIKTKKGKKYREARTKKGIRYNPQASKRGGADYVY